MRFSTLLGVTDSGDAHTRVGDRERQGVVDRLSAATADGLLTLDEMADAAGATYAALTRADLDAVVRPLNLPATTESPTPGPAVAPKRRAGRRRWVVAVMSGEERKGRWRLRRRTGAFALMGGVVLDLRGAVLEADEVQIAAWAVMGSVTVIVPEGIPVESTGFVLMGGRSTKVEAVPLVPGAPVVRIRGYGMWGEINVRSQPASTATS